MGTKVNFFLSEMEPDNALTMILQLLYVSVLSVDEKTLCTADIESIWM